MSPFREIALLLVPTESQNRQSADIARKRRSTARLQTDARPSRNGSERFGSGSQAYGSKAVSAACSSSRHAWAADGLSVRPTKHGQSNVEVSGPRRCTWLRARARACAPTRHGRGRARGCGVGSQAHRARPRGLNESTVTSPVTALFKLYSIESAGIGYTALAQGHSRATGSIPP